MLLSELFLPPGMLRMFPNATCIVLIANPTVKITKENGETFTVMEDGKFKLG
jgi:hypothetical protein